MTPKKLTALFIGVTIAVITAFDVYVYSQGGTEATISWTIFEWSSRHSVVAFAFGFVMGHLFWQMKPQAKLSGESDKEKV